MAKICDFGLAKKVSSEQSNKKRKRKWKLNPYFRGTPMYLSPEAIVEGEQGTPSDIWGIGCVVLEMLTGKPVWDRKKDWKTKEFLRKIGYEFKIPEIPSEISTEAKEFLNSCFVRNDRARLSADMLLKLPFVKSIGDEEEGEEEEDCNIESNDWNIESCSDNFYFRSSSKISESLDVKEEVRSIEPSDIAYYIDNEEEEDEPIEDYEEEEPIEEEEEPTEDYEEEEPIEEEEEEEEPIEDYEEEEEPIEEEEEEEEEPAEDHEEEEEPIEDYDCIHSFARVMMTANEDQNVDAKDLKIPDHKRRRMDV